MALPILPLAAGAGVLLFLLTNKSSAASGYSQAPADGSSPPVKEPKAPSKTWKEMPPALQEQVAAALGALGVSPATGELSGQPVTAEAIQMATQTAALCESQGFYEVAAELRRLIKGAVVSVPTPPSAAPIKAAAPPGLSPEQIEALARTLTLDRDPKSIQALIETLSKLPPSPQRDHLIAMAQALLLQLQSAQSTTQTMQQIDQVIKSPGIAEVHAAVQPLPPVVIPVITAPKPPASSPPVYSPPKVTAPPQTTPASIPQAAAAAAMTLTYAALLPLTGTRILKSGLKGIDVQAWQNILRLDGYASSVAADGAYSPKTVAATKAWQKQRGLTADGQVGPNTRAKVGTAPGAAVATPPKAIPQQPAAPTAQKLVFASVIDPSPTSITLRKGDKGNAVLSWQNILVALGYGSTIGKPDGDFSAKTDTATRALQTYARDHYKDSKPITVDGVVGPQTRRIVVARTAQLRGVVVSGRHAA